MTKDKRNQVSTQPDSRSKYWDFIKKNGFTIFLVLFMGILLTVPNAKSFVIQQLITTGLFNASIDNKSENQTSPITIDFDFVDENGHLQNTSSLRGKVVFINFWASWCPPCRAEFPSIENLYTKLKDNPNVFFLIVNQDCEQSEGKKYLHKEGFTVPFYTTSGSIPDVVYNGTLPTTVIWDKKGNIRFHKTGFANYASPKFIRQLEQLSKE